MGEASSAVARGQRQDAMADLEQALELAAAWFGGDATAAEWGHVDDQQQSGMLTAADFNLLDQPLMYGGDALPLPGSAAGAAAEDWEGCGSGILHQEGSTTLPPPSMPLMRLEQEASDEPSIGGDSGLAAKQIAQGLQHMQLDEIDSELADAMAPGRPAASLSMCVGGVIHLPHCWFHSCCCLRCYCMLFQAIPSHLLMHLQALARWLSSLLSCTSWRLLGRRLSGRWRRRHLSKRRPLTWLLSMLIL